MSTTRGFEHAYIQEFDEATAAFGLHTAGVYFKTPADQDDAARWFIEGFLYAKDPDNA